MMFQAHKFLLHSLHVYGFFFSVGPVKYLPQNQPFSLKTSQTCHFVMFQQQKFCCIASIRFTFPVFMDVLGWCFFITGFLQLDIKVIVERTENCISSNLTFLSIAKNRLLQFLILKQYEEGQKQAIIVFSISCNSQKCLIRKHAIFSSCNYYLHV